MTAILHHTQTLTAFARNSRAAAGQIKRSGNPIVLTVNGKAQLVVQDAKAYEKLVVAADYADALRGIRRGLVDVNAGRTRTLAKFDAAFRRKHKLARQK